MNKNSQNITAEDAQVALASIEAARKTTANHMRPPIWLVLLCSVSLAIKTTSMGLMINNGWWQSLQWGSYTIICISVTLWIIALRAKGITIKITDVNISKKGVISALLICALLLSSRAIYLQTGSTVFPYLAGILNAFVLAYSLLFGRLLQTKKRAEDNE